MGEGTWPKGDRHSVQRRQGEACTSCRLRPRHQLFLRRLRRRSVRVHRRQWRGRCFHSVGAGTCRGSLAVLRPRGTLVQFGKASGSPEPVDPFELAPRALYLTWPILPHYTSTAEDLAIAAAALFDAIATGILKVDPSHLYPFSQLIEAHHDLEERRTTGAAVLRVTAAGSPLIKFHALQRPKTPAARIHETILN